MLKLFSSISFCVTIPTSLALFALQNRSIGFGKLKFSLDSKYFSSEFFSLFLVIALYVYRKLCALPIIIFNCYVVTNATIMISFTIVRFYAISFENNKLYFYLIFFAVGILTLTTGLIRFFFNIGFQIDQNPHIVLSLLQRFSQSSVHLFSNVGRKISGDAPLSPGSSGFDRYFALGLGTLVAGSGVYLCYEAYQSRMLNIRNLEVSQRALNVTEVNSDRQAVKDGFLTRENYHKKWDEFGRPEKVQ